MTWCGPIAVKYRFCFMKAVDSDFLAMSGLGSDDRFYSSHPPLGGVIQRECLIGTVP